MDASDFLRAAHQADRMSAEDYTKEHHGFVEDESVGVGTAIIPAAPFTPGRYSGPFTLTACHVMFARGPPNVTVFAACTGCCCEGFCPSRVLMALSLLETTHSSRSYFSACLFRQGVCWYPKSVLSVLRSFSYVDSSLSHSLVAMSVSSFFQCYFFYPFQIIPHMVFCSDFDQKVGAWIERLRTHGNIGQAIIMLRFVLSFFMCSSLSENVPGRQL